MNTLTKPARVPLLRRFMEDFWNNESLIDRPFFTADTQWPAVNIKENEKDFEIEVAAPGFQKEDFQLNLQNNVLSISAENRRENKEQKDNYTRQEFSYSSFNRSFSLPETVEDGEIKARYENGLLHLSVQKTAQPQNQKKTIPIE